MDTDPEDRLRDRIRWLNVARAAGLLATIALVVAWPHVGDRSPRLPEAGAVPLSPPPRSSTPPASEFGPEAAAPRPRRRATPKPKPKPKLRPKPKRKRESRRRPVPVVPRPAPPPPRRLPPKRRPAAHPAPGGEFAP